MISQQRRASASREQRWLLGIALFLPLLNGLAVDIGFGLRPYRAALPILACVVLWRRQTVRLYRHDVGFILLCVYMLVTGFLFNDNPEPNLRSALNFGTAFAYYLLLCALARGSSWRDMLCSVHWVVVALLLSCGVLYLDARYQITPVSGWLLEHRLGLVWHPGRNHNRMTGVDGDPNSLCLTLALAVFVGMHGFTQRSTRLRSAALVMTAIFFLLLTGSRGGVVATIPAMVGAGTLMLWRQRLRAVALALLTGVGLAAIDAAGGLEMLSERFAIASNEYRGSRLFYLQTGLELFLADPVFGIGFGQFAVRNAELNFDYHVMHNAHAEFLFQGGVVGFGIYVVALLLFFRFFLLRRRGSQERQRRDLLLFLGFTLMGQMVMAFSVSDLQMPFWVTLALVVSVATAPADDRFLDTKMATVAV